MKQVGEVWKAYSSFPVTSACKILVWSCVVVFIKKPDEMLHV